MRKSVLPPLRREDGMVMATVLFALVILGVVAVAVLRVSSDGLQAGRAFRESALALYAAEAGLNFVTATWPTATATALEPGDSVNLGWQNLPNGARYRAVISRVDGGGGMRSYLLVVHGRGAGAGAHAGERAVARSLAESSVAKWGLFGRDEIKIGGSGSGVDSYNSNLGPYDAATANHNGHLATNGGVILNSATWVKGDISAGTTIKNITSMITGTATEYATPFPPYDPVPCPTGGFTPAAYVPNTTGVTYNSTTGVLKVGGGNNLTLSAATTYYFSEVELSGGSTLTINEGSGQHVAIWINGQFKSGGGGVVNTSAKPTGLTLWACGDPGAKPAPWVVNGGSGAYFAMYAPDREVVVGGGGDLWGSVVGLKLEITGGSRLHYDEALGSGSGTIFRVVPGSWTELTLF